MFWIYIDLEPALISSLTFLLMKRHRNSRGKCSSHWTPYSGFHARFLMTLQTLLYLFNITVNVSVEEPWRKNPTQTGTCRLLGYAGSFLLQLNPVKLSSTECAERMLSEVWVCCVLGWDAFMITAAVFRYRSCFWGKCLWDQRAGSLTQYNTDVRISSVQPAAESPQNERCQHAARCSYILLMTTWPLGY